jgi:dihydroorotase
MTILIKQARINCAQSPLHGQTQDILITDGAIQQIASSISGYADKTISAIGLQVSIGWMDIFANFGDPGYEHKETLVSGTAAAAAGGYTDVMVLPNNSPSTSTKSIVEYIKQKAVSLPVNIYPIGTVTKNAEGKELTEMYDMFASGAVAFSDGTNSIQSPGVLLKALQYVLPLGAIVIQVPDDKSISSYGLMNEGILSTQLGLPGKPAIAEELMIARDIELLKYTKSKLHITGISTKKGIELIAAAKKEGLQISCSVTPLHLWFCDEDLSTYDTNLKVNPPLRTSADREALQQALNDGTIDCIASHHFPQHWDDKTCEFEYAKTGAITLESAFAVTNSFIRDTSHLIDLLTAAPRNIFGLPVPELKEGVPACLTLFTADDEFIFEEKMIRSKSRNSAFTGRKLKGRVIGTINNNKISMNDQ